LRELGDYKTLKAQRLADIKNRGVRSYDLGLAADALEAASWNPLKTVWADKHAQGEHGTGRDERDDIFDIICGSDVSANCFLFLILTRDDNS
jgi:hypothetical protein